MNTATALEEEITTLDNDLGAFDRLIEHIGAAGSINEAAEELIEDAIMLYEAGNFTGCLAMLDRMKEKQVVNE